MEGTLPRSATCEAVITTYASRADVPSDYCELAFIESEGNSVCATDNQLRAEIRKRAAEEGATAVIVNPVSESKVGVKVLGEALGTRSATSSRTPSPQVLRDQDGRSARASHAEGLVPAFVQEVRPVSPIRRPISLRTPVAPTVRLPTDQRRALPSIRRESPVPATSMLLAKSIGA